MAKDINKAVWNSGFRFFPNYVRAMNRMETPEEQGRFARAIIRFMFFDEQPNFEPDSEAGFCWDMIEPNLKSSKRQAQRGQGAPKGNQNARKDKGQREEHNPQKNATGTPNFFDV